MNLQELYDLKHKRAEKLAEGKTMLTKKDFEGHSVLMADVAKMNAEIDAAEKQLAEEGRFEDSDEKMKGLANQMQQEKEADQKELTVDALRGSNEYARAFAKAMRNKAQVDDCRGVEALAPLYKALTESGGTPNGSDGGFLVPIDFDNRIQRLEKEYLDLASLFNVESVNTLTGWRVVENGVPTALPLVSELGTGVGTIGKNDQPKFKRLEYSVKKYADRVAISGELMEDNAAGLLAYIAEWFGPKYIMTKNARLLAFLTALTNSLSLKAGSEDRLLRKALITKLNTAHSRSATLLTNQNGYAEMDGWADTTGRPLLVPNPADPQVLRYRGRQLAYGDNDLIADEAGGIPLYVGNLKALATLFVRKGIELATTNVGGDAWATGSYEVRAICRMDAQLVDPKAAFKAIIPPASAG